MTSSSSFNLNVFSNMFSIGTADHNEDCCAHVFRCFRVRFGDCGDCLARRRWCSLSGCFYHRDIVVADVGDDNHHVGSNRNEAACESGARAVCLIHCCGLYVSCA
ncbi:EsV-1-38 [Ectocarpus siliculosus virus 1]|uniref:EsV-1-38 n=1 Tax=Ectocarpus siliculosus virus 1 (isolate New Zealand/Kaikoura/1988) TaxID=654926 RepID=Q8QNM6_ESV1K|nr:EsV-1-38 [Ectocarpus siliculosus virus 1]AAK14464.1 EsV-1-38 [Ectocarpus siliculosus virus 1]